MSNQVNTGQVTLTNDIALKIKEHLLLNLANRSIGAFMNKTLAITPEEQVTGHLRIIKYKKIELENEYDGSAIRLQKPASETVTIEPSGEIAARWTWETLDTPLAVEGVVANIGKSLALSIALRLDALYFDAACKATANVVDIGALKTDITEEESKSLLIKLSDAKVDLEMLVNNYYVGLDKMDLHMSLNPKVVSRLGISIANREKYSTDLISESTNYYSGIDALVTKSILLNQKIEQDADGSGIVTSSTGIDLKDVYGFIVHREALLVRSLIPTMRTIPSPDNGNDIIVFKSRYWKQTIRPGLVTAITNGLDVDAVKAKGEFTLA